MGTLKELKMIFSLRAWLKSTSLQTGGIIGALGAVQTYLGTTDGMDLLTLLAGLVHLPVPVLNGVAMMGTGLIIWLLRAKAQWSLTEVASGADQVTEGRRSTDTPPKKDGGYVRLTVVYVLLVVSILVVMRALFG
jgi:hypothetical protein